MRVLYISSPFFFDMDLSLIQNLSNKVELYYLIDLPPFALKSTFMDISNRKPVSAILNAKEYCDLEGYSEFLDLSKTYLINRQSKRVYSFGNLKIQFSIIRFIHFIDPDIIHSNNFLNLNFLPFLFQNKRPIILTDHDPIPHSGDDNTRDCLLRKINYRFIKKHILLNSVQKQEYIRKYNLKETNIYLSSLGIYTYLKKLATKQIKSEKNSILFFGRISQYKGLEYLIEAVGKVKNDLMNIKLTIAGAGDFNFDIDPNPDSSHIRIINRHIANDELINLILEAKFIVCPYTDATQSGVVMTAYALKKPVIASKVGGLPEMVIDGSTGLLVPPKDVPALSNSILRLLKDEELLNKMSRNIEDIYHNGDKSWKSITDKLIFIYKDVLNR